MRKEHDYGARKGRLNAGIEKGSMIECEKGNSNVTECDK
jgi:hypothetical protein